MNEKSVMNHLGKKAVAGILAFVLIVSGIFFMPSGNREVLASGDVSFITEKYENIADFRSGGAGNYTAPKPSTKDCEDWLFAGWFTDDTCVTAYKGTKGTAYAKFVPAEVLSVKCQVTSKTDADTKSCKMRLVTTVDSLRYSEVGFDIEYKGNKMNVPIKTVLKTIAATDSGINYPYTPQIFHEKSNYFATVILKNLANSDFDEPFYIQPYWKTLDGTVVYGVRRYARVEDYYFKIINVPVRLYTDAQVAAGYLEVSYDKNIYTLYGEADPGTVFQEVEAYDTGNGIVRCVGNVKDISDNVRADGMYANLRFQLKSNESWPTTDVTFDVTGEAFCNRDEEFVYTNTVEQTFDVPSVVFKAVPVSE